MILIKEQSDLLVASVKLVIEELEFDIKDGSTVTDKTPKQLDIMKTITDITDFMDLYSVQRECIIYSFQKYLINHSDVCIDDNEVDAVGDLLDGWYLLQQLLGTVNLTDTSLYDFLDQPEFSNGPEDKTSILHIIAEYVTNLLKIK